MVVICDFHSQGQGSIPCGGDSKDTNSNTNIVYLPNGGHQTFNLNLLVRFQNKPNLMVS